MGHVAKIFRSGNSQAVRLPKDFRFNVDEVEISRDGDALILRPCAKARPQWSFLRMALDRGFSPDFMQEGRQQPEEQPRSGLDELFK